MAKTTVIVEVFLTVVCTTANYSLPASAFEIPEGCQKEYENEEALTVVAALPNVGMGNRDMFELLFEMGNAAKRIREDNPWLKVTVQHIK